jgi:hypothetical protein
VLGGVVAEERVVRSRRERGDLEHADLLAATVHQGVIGPLDFVAAIEPAGATRRDCFDDRGCTTFFRWFRLGASMHQPHLPTGSECEGLQRLV